MKKYVILGHHNLGLSLLLENLHACGVTNQTVDIISNLPDGENPLAHFEYAVQGIKIRKLRTEQWTPQTGSIYMNSGMSGRSRKIIYEHFLQNHGIETLQYGNSIHPSSVVATTARIGPCMHLGPLSCIAAYTQIGCMFFMNRSSSLGHHAQIGDFVNISCGCDVGSQTIIEDQVIIGLGAKVFDRVKIGKNSVIGGGSVVTKDIPEGVIAYGVPAKVIRSVDS